MLYEVYDIDSLVLVTWFLLLKSPIFEHTLMGDTENSIREGGGGV